MVPTDARSPVCAYPPREPEGPAARLRIAVEPEGDSALVVRFDADEDGLPGLVAAAADALGSRELPSPCEAVLSRASLMVCYNPLKATFAEMSAAVYAVLAGLAAAPARERRVIEIPVCYGGRHGCDLADVAAYARMGEDEVVALHAGRAYRIDMLGFLPGFAYLSGLDGRLAMPRLAVPRPCVAAGSVGIGGAQTGVYPVASPGGWRIIGRTPARLFDPARPEPVLYRAGDWVRFRPIDEDAFENLAARAERGEEVCGMPLGQGDGEGGAR